MNTLDTVENPGLTAISGQVTYRHCLETTDKDKELTENFAMKLTDNEVAAIWQRIRNNQLTNADMATMAEVLIFMPSLERKAKQITHAFCSIFRFSFQIP